MNFDAGFQLGLQTGRWRLRCWIARRRGGFSVVAIVSFRVSPFDPLVLILAAVFVLILALAAAFLPAHRAASVDPMQALRTD